MNNQTVLHKMGRYLLFALALAVTPQMAHGQAGDPVEFFKYNIENVVVTPTAPGSWKVKAIFSVTNPITGIPWNIKNDLPFTSTGAGLTVDIGWGEEEFTNFGSAYPSLTEVTTTALGTGAAMPVRVTRLQGAATACDAAHCPGVDPLLPNRFWVEAIVTPKKFIRDVTTGRVALEGKPVCNGIGGVTCPTAVAPFANVPVPSAVASFRFTATESLAAIIPDPRRKIVDINKCKQCHDGKPHGATVIPKLSLHGNNRTENLGLCVICHNPNQTDVPYRYKTSATAPDLQINGPETPIDFKVMVHSIHAGGFRTQPYVVVGFNSSVNNFSYVRFPRELRDCTNCHVNDANGKGTFELPLKPEVLGTTKISGSVYQEVLSGSTRTISVNPVDDVKISPTAAVCSSCHDKAEVKSHMERTGGASFATTQAAIGMTVKERCANCHGPGKDEDVRKAHEIRSGSGSSSRSRDD